MILRDMIYRTLFKLRLSHKKNALELVPFKIKDLLTLDYREEKIASVENITGDMEKLTTKSALRHVKGILWKAVEEMALIRYSSLV